MPPFLFTLGPVSSPSLEALENLFQVTVESRINCQWAHLCPLSTFLSLACRLRPRFVLPSLSRSMFATYRSWRVAAR